MCKLHLKVLFSFMKSQDFAFGSRDTAICKDGGGVDIFSAYRGCDLVPIENMTTRLSNYVYQDDCFPVFPSHVIPVSGDV